jgi:hypothetical protein
MLKKHNSKYISLDYLMLLLNLTHSPSLYFGERMITPRVSFNGIQPRKVYEYFYMSRAHEWFPLFLGIDVIVWHLKLHAISRFFFFLLAIQKARCPIV